MEKEQIKEKPKRKSWKQRRGLVSQVIEEQKFSGNRRSRRNDAKVFIKDPLNFHKNYGIRITNRGVLYGRS